MDFFRIELSLTMSKSCLDFNWWAIQEGLLGIGSEYRLFQLRKMHQKCQKVASLVLVSPLDFGHLYNFLFSRYSLQVFRYAFDIFKSPGRKRFLSFCHLLLGHSLDIFLSSTCMCLHPNLYYRYFEYHLETKFQCILQASVCLYSSSLTMAIFGFFFTPSKFYNK